MLAVSWPTPAGTAIDMSIGVGLSSEELGPLEIVRAAALAEEVGFTRVWVSDHFHPWIDAQGSSPFVWSVLGGIARATDRIRVGTGVTCPIMRIHPAIVAQAAATTQCMFEGRFWLGVGSGEALNEHITGQKWPEASVRLEMLEEAVAILRQLWKGGQTSHYGKHFTVENARIYTLPDEPPEIYVSAFGEQSVKLAARIGDGLVSTRPDSETTDAFMRLGGKGPKLAQVKVAWASSVAKARDLVFERWPTAGLTGELKQELPTPRHFEEAASVLSKEDVTASFPCGPDPQVHIDAITQFLDAGFDDVYVTQVGPDQSGFARFYEREVLPHFRRSENSAERAAVGVRQ
jgi:G6PDH family F420-dependent oxidoreductase